MKTAKKKSQVKIENAFLQLVQDKEAERITVTEICKLANVNRTTFYANYTDVYDLVDNIRERMMSEYAALFREQREVSRENFLKMFNDIKKNQAFYKTYFKLGFDVNYKIVSFDKNLAKQLYNNELIDYHCEFFQAGITAVIKKWLNGNCRETPEEIMGIIDAEYKNKMEPFR